MNRLQLCVTRQVPWPLNRPRRLIAFPIPTSFEWKRLYDYRPRSVSMASRIRSAKVDRLHLRLIWVAMLAAVL